MERGMSRCLVALVVLSGLVAPTPARADCIPGVDGCMPTPEQCASCDYNGFWDGGSPGRAAVCVGAEGHTLAYAGGKVGITSGCGHIVVADQTLYASEDDPNHCSPIVERVRLPMHDGVELDAAIWRPSVPDGVRVPVVVHATPYPGQWLWVFPEPGYLPPVEDPVWLVRPGLDRLLEQGYAVVNLNVRGTGRSGGCFELGGANEQRDMGTVVELLAEAPWSNARVAMYGLSYMGQTPWYAAIQGVEALKTVVVAATVTDEYTFTFTPQGAARGRSVLHVMFGAAQLGLPNAAVHPETAADPRLPGYATAFAERACPEFVRVTTVSPHATATDERDADYFDVRRTVDHYGDVTAAVFLVHGFADNQGHLTQDDHVWNTLTQAPRRMMLGQWGHEYPGQEHLSQYPHGDSWIEVLTEWLDYWLKDVGDEPPREGVVDYQRPDGTWAASSAWPPAEAREQALYLDSGSLRGEPGTQSATFTSLTGPAGHGRWEFPEAASSAYCEPQSATAELGPTGLAFVTESADEPVLVAGNPFAYLSVESNLPGGIVSLDLYDVSPDASCSPTGTGSGVTWISGGAADLRFHQGSFTGSDFPVGTTTPVRIDLSNLAWTVEPGHHLALVVTGPGSHGHMGQPYQPLVTLHGDASHVILPVVEGTLGGAPTAIEYPPRPFLP